MFEFYIKCKSSTSQNKPNHSLGTNCNVPDCYRLFFIIYLRKGLTLLMSQSIYNIQYINSFVSTHKKYFAPDLLSIIKYLIVQIEEWSQLVCPTLTSRFVPVKIISPSEYSVLFCFLLFWKKHQAPFLSSSAQTLVIWTRSCLGSPLRVSHAVCQLCSLTPSALWKPLCSTKTPALSLLPARWSSPFVAPLQPIPTQQKQHTTYQVRGDACCFFLSLRCNRLRLHLTFALVSVMQMRFKTLP